MPNGNAPAYGLWSLVIVNSLVFILFAFSFAKPQTPSERGGGLDARQCRLRAPSLCGSHRQAGVDLGRTSA